MLDTLFLSFIARQQNPAKQSRWGELARSGHQVVQFRDVQANKLSAIAVDGVVKEYGGGSSGDQTAADTG